MLMWTLLHLLHLLHYLHYLHTHVAVYVDIDTMRSNIYISYA